MGTPLYKFLLDRADDAVRDPGGIIRPGHNGPYHDPETPIRVQGHWLITFLWAWRWTGEARYREIAAKLAESIVDPQWREGDASFHHRDSAKKDHCNGLIGQAWSFEALTAAAAAFDAPEHLDLAGSVFLKHPFNETCGLWNRLETDGRVLSIDATFNHQLWFAATAAALPLEEARRRAARFMDELPGNLTVLEDGLIYHPILRTIDDPHAGKKPQRSARSLVAAARNRMRGAIGSLLGRKESPDQRAAMIHKSIGYHNFNTFALALLKKELPDHSFWRSEPFSRIVSYLRSDAFFAGLEGNSFGYPYNAPGFEVPYSLAVLVPEADQNELIERSRRFVNRQLELTYNTATCRFDRGNPDPSTLTSRIYALTRLPNGWLESISVEADGGGGRG